MKDLRPSLLSVACSLFFAFPLSTLAQDQPSVRTVDGYLSLYGGVNSPFETDIRETSPGVDLTIFDAKVDSSVSFGGKAGVWFLATRPHAGIDLGIELDIMNFRPDIKPDQVVRFQGTLVGTPVAGSATTNHFDMNSTLFSVNLLARLPIGVTDQLPNGRWAPYLGIGAGFQRTSLCLECTEKAVDTAPAFQALAGIKVFLIRNLAVFGEYKFTHTSHTFEIRDPPTGIITKEELDVTANHFVGGLSLHF
jgi:opacity protein-like surface antigen